MDEDTIPDLKWDVFAALVEFAYTGDYWRSIPEVPENGVAIDRSPDTTGRSSVVGHGSTPEEIKIVKAFDEETWVPKNKLKKKIALEFPSDPFVPNVCYHHPPSARLPY